MVYVHGGGHAIGNGINTGKINIPNLVKLSMKEGKDVVVTISYRLHFLGWLASKDLMEYNAANNEVPCNYGMYDTRNAFLWIKKNIAAFGGDPDQVTAFGKSAGSITVSQHMCSDILNLFRRAILQSGMPASIAPCALEKHEHRYRGLLERLQIPYEGVSAQQRIQSLIDVPIEKFDAILQPKPQFLTLSKTLRSSQFPFLRKIRTSSCPNAIGWTSLSLGM